MLIGSMRVAIKESAKLCIGVWISGAIEKWVNGREKWFSSIGDDAETVKTSPALFPSSRASGDPTELPPYGDIAGGVEGGCITLGGDPPCENPTMPVDRALNEGGV